jgi:hypothetical protein
MRLTWRPQPSPTFAASAPARQPALNVGIVVAVLLASLAAGFLGGVIVWALWRFDLLHVGELRRHR